LGKLPKNKLGGSRVILLSCLLMTAFVAIACKSGPAVSVRLMPNSVQTLESGKSIPISATLSNDSARQGVRWDLTGAGSLVAETPTSVMYQAPANISEMASVTVTATSIANGKRVATLQIILVPPKKASTANKNHQGQGVRG
jgi:hypothetical protein